MEKDVLSEGENIAPPTAKERIRAYLSTRKGMRQFLQSLLVSLFKGPIEVLAFVILAWILKPLYAPAQWWIFEYTADEGGWGALISYLSSVTLAQVIAFTLNRKRVFKASNNLAFSIVSYTFLVIFIIWMQVFFAPILLSAYSRIIRNYMWAASLAKLSLMAITFPIVFFSSKYVIMREKKA